MLALSAALLLLCEPVKLLLSSFKKKEFSSFVVFFTLGTDFFLATDLLIMISAVATVTHCAVCLRKDRVLFSYDT